MADLRRPHDGAAHPAAPRREDPVLIHARREAIVICVIWTLATFASCIISYWLGYDRPGRPLGPDDLKPVFGMPLWFFWGVIVPWAVCIVVTWWFAGLYMKEDDLGKDHAAELEGDIREGGEHA